MKNPAGGEGVGLRPGRMGASVAARHRPAFGNHRLRFLAFLESLRLIRLNRKDAKNAKKNSKKPPADFLLQATGP